MSDKNAIAPDPVMALIRPQMGENIGAAARAMWNFGLDRMRLTAPRDGWPNTRAVALASGAGRLLDQAQVYETTQAALLDCHIVYATTARDRSLGKPVLTPEAAMQEARNAQRTGQNVAILFGPERSGLENDDLTYAHRLISIPVNPEFPSLNLAQAVLLLGYEWRRVIANEGAACQTAVNKPPLQLPAKVADIEALSRHYEQTLDEAGFFFPPDKAEPMKQNLRNLWSRLSLSHADVRIFHGMLRQLRRWRDQTASE